MKTPEEIRKILIDNNITGYRIEKDLNISQVGADKFLNGTTKKPTKKVLELYNNYIKNNFKPITTYQSTKENIFVNEENTEYNLLSGPEKKIYENLANIQKYREMQLNIDKNSLSYKQIEEIISIIYEKNELLKNSKKND